MEHCEQQSKSNSGVPLAFLFIFGIGYDLCELCRSSRQSLKISLYEFAGIDRPGSMSATRKLKELVRAYETLSVDTRRTMTRIKAMFRGRGIRTSGRGVYQPKQREQWLEMRWTARFSRIRPSLTRSSHRLLELHSRPRTCHRDHHRVRNPQRVRPRSLKRNRRFSSSYVRTLKKRDNPNLEQ